MSAQCNLAVEAGNLVHFKQNFRDARSIRFPTPVEGFYHPLVLVESFEPGIHVERYSTISPLASAATLHTTATTTTTTTTKHHARMRAVPPGSPERTSPLTSAKP